MLRFKGVEMSGDFTVKSQRQLREAQDYIDSETVKLLEDYTPIAMPRFRNRGKMSKSHKVETPGVIINTEPTARKEYYTNKGFSGQGRFWLERMKADHKEDILRGLKK